METTNAEHYGKKIIAALYLALLCISLYFTLFGNSDARKIARLKADLRSFSGAIDSYYVDNNQYPTPDEAVTARTSDEIEEEAHRSAPEEPLLISHTYDPTNGITVMGDVYRTRQ